MKKRIARLVLSLVLLILAASPWVPAAQADLSCGDCFSICILRNCGFSPDPACQEAYWGPCAAECQPPACD